MSSESKQFSHADPSQMAGDLAQSTEHSMRMSKGESQEVSAQTLDKPLYSGDQITIAQGYNLDSADFDIYAALSPVAKGVKLEEAAMAMPEIVIMHNKAAEKNGRGETVIGIMTTNGEHRTVEGILLPNTEGSVAVGRDLIKEAVGIGLDSKLAKMISGNHLGVELAETGFGARITDTSSNGSEIVTAVEFHEAADFDNEDTISDPDDLARIQAVAAKQKEDEAQAGRGYEAANGDVIHGSSGAINEMISTGDIVGAIPETEAVESDAFDDDDTSQAETGGQRHKEILARIAEQKATDEANLLPPEQYPDGSSMIYTTEKGGRYIGGANVIEMLNTEENRGLTEVPYETILAERRNGTKVQVKEFDFEGTLISTPKEQEEVFAEFGQAAQTESVASGVPVTTLEQDLGMNVEVEQTEKPEAEQVGFRAGTAVEVDHDVSVLIPETESAQVEAEDSEEVLEEPEFLSQEELLADHFEDLLSGVEIEGADLEMQQHLAEELQSIEKHYAEVIRDQNLGFIEADLKKIVLDAREGGLDLDSLQRELSYAENALTDFADATARATQDLYDGGLIQFAENSKNAFANAKDNLDLLNPQSAISRIEQGVTAESRDLARKLEHALAVTNDKIRTERAQAEIPSAQVRNRFVQAMKAGGNTIKGLDAVISSEYPEQSEISRSVSEVEDFADSLAILTNVIDGAGFTEQIVSLRDTYQRVAERIQPGRVEMDPGQINDLSRTAQQLAEGMYAARSAVIRAKSSAPA